MPAINVIHINRRLADNSVYRLGTCVHYVDGWRFISNHQAHRSSRKFWPTWEAAVPRWTGYPGHTELEFAKTTSLCDKPMVTG